MTCTHAGARELRQAVWWCEDCGAVQLATGDDPKPGEWIAPRAERRRSSTAPPPPASCGCVQGGACEAHAPLAR